MKVKILIESKNILFDYKFFDPIDKKWAYFNKGEEVFFGVCKKWAGEIANTFPTKVDFDTMTVSAI
jgi:hypothetical protein